MTFSGIYRPYLLFILLLSLSCHKKDIVGPQGPQGSGGQSGSNGAISKGDIQGKVLLYDTLGKPLPGNSGATVFLENTSPLLQAVTSADGSFTIPSVPPGDYNLSIQGQGYGTMRYLNVVNAGTTTPSQTGILSLGQQMPSQYDVKALKVDSGAFPPISGGGYFLTFTVTLAHPQKVTNPVLIYFNDSTGVGNSNNKFVYWSAFTQLNDTTLVYPAFDYSLSFASDKLHNANFLYLSVAIDNAKHLSYKDEHGNQVYPDASKPSPQVIVNNVLHKY
jgi:hypothetical protein